MNWLDLDVKGQGHSGMKYTKKKNLSTTLKKFNTGWNRHQIFTVDALGDKDELIEFGGQKVKVQGHGMTECGVKTTL